MSATGFPELWELESQKETSAAENAALSQLIYKNNSKKALKDMQIVRFGGVAIAIYRPRDAKGVPRGSFGSVYRAYPIIMCNPVDNSLNGRIDKSIELAVKIVGGTGRTIKNDGDEASSQARKNDIQVIGETSNDNAVLSARTTRIPSLEKSADGHTIYQTAILMSAAPGIDLRRFLKDKVLRKVLTPERRLRLAINVVKAYRALHAEGICHGDIKPENILVDPHTLLVTIIDLDNRARTPITIAPEDYELYQSKGKIREATEESDIYSIAQGLLIPLLADRAFCAGMKEIKRERFFDNHLIRSSEKATLRKNLGFHSKSPELQEMVALLNSMRYTEPEKRWSLETVQAILELLLQQKDPSYIITNSLSQNPDEAHTRKLWSLDSVLMDPKYQIISHSADEISSEPFSSINNSVQNIKVSTHLYSFLSAKNTIDQTHHLNTLPALSDLTISLEVNLGK